MEYGSTWNQVSHLLFSSQFFSRVLLQQHETCAQVHCYACGTYQAVTFRTPKTHVKCGKRSLSRCLQPQQYLKPSSADDRLVWKYGFSCTFKFCSPFFNHENEGVESLISVGVKPFKTKNLITAQSSILSIS